MFLVCIHSSHYPEATKEAQDKIRSLGIRFEFVHAVWLATIMGRSIECFLLVHGPVIEDARKRFDFAEALAEGLQLNGKPLPELVVFFCADGTIYPYKNGLITNSLSF